MWLERAAPLAPENHTNAHKDHPEAGEETNLAQKIYKNDVKSMGWPKKPMKYNEVQKYI